MGTDENVTHINGDVSSYTALLKLTECETLKIAEENTMQEGFEISERVCFDEQVRFNVRFIRFITI